MKNLGQLALILFIVVLVLAALNLGNNLLGSLLGNRAPVSGQNPGTEERPTNTPPTREIANCHALDRGTLEANPSFSVGSITQVNYWIGGPPEYDVLVDPGTYQRADGYRGKIWEWVGCSLEQAESAVEGSWGAREADGVAVGGWGDASFLTKLN